MMHTFRIEHNCPYCKQMTSEDFCQSEFEKLVCCSYCNMSYMLKFTIGVTDVYIGKIKYKKEKHKNAK